MKIETVERNNKKIAIVENAEAVINDAQSTLDFIMTVQYDTGCDLIAVNKDAVSESFFVLSTKLAGDILQKFINYRVRFAIYGDFSIYTSKPLKDFIYECNQSGNVFFTESKELAIDKLSKVR